jgi:hypothetical protein
MIMQRRYREADGDGDREGYAYFWQMFTPHREEEVGTLCSLIGWKMFTIDPMTIHFSTSLHAQVTTTSQERPLPPSCKGFAPAPLGTSCLRATPCRRFFPCSRGSSFKI